MSAENVKKFFDELDKNPELRRKFDNAMSTCDTTRAEIVSAKLLELAKNAGFEYSENDLQKAVDECGELSDADMEKVSGGYWKCPPIYYIIKYGKKKD